MTTVVNIDVNVVCDAPDGNAVSGFIFEEVSADSNDDEARNSNANLSSETYHDCNDNDKSELRKYQGEDDNIYTSQLIEEALNNENDDEVKHADGFILSAADLAAKVSKLEGDCSEHEVNDDLNQTNSHNIAELPAEKSESKHSSDTSIDKKSFEAEIKAVQELQSAKPVQLYGTGSLGRGIDINNVPG